MIRNKSLYYFILALVSLLSSRGLFALVSDPEGPNLLVVLVLAAVIFAILVSLRKIFSK